MRRARGLILILILLSVFGETANASLRGDVKSGNLLYNNKKYDEAIKIYEKALSSNSGAGIVNFNIGDALYKKSIYNDAIESFNKAIASGDSNLTAGADYNIGNSLYRIGSAKRAGDPKGAKEQYEAALEFYKRSIDLDPKDKDAKFNYEFVQRRLKELAEEREEKEKEEKKEKSKEEKKGGEREGEKERPETKSGGSEGTKEQKSQPEKGGGGKDERPSEARKEDAESKKEEDGKAQTSQGAKSQRHESEKEKGLEAYEAPQEEAGEMSEEEAKMLLEGYKGEEATAKSIRLRRKPIDIQEPLKDW